MKNYIALFTIAATCAVSATAFTSRHAAVPALQKAFVSRTATPNTIRMMSTAPADLIKSEIESNDIVIFSKSFCPFCSKTKRVFAEMERGDAVIIELDKRPDGKDIQSALLEMTGQRTVPNVFIKGQHLGGNDDTQQAKKSGKLQEMLE
mmetsp:Transcript_17689/g.27083  ORF Transcript_17689/g.27083 Transcript_17689/m.27083 type:complete len:149 (-) Transcript_17689:62-508(-)|eukprot:CAMPEP_0118694052 /NCGR_PEP_ID=MMETSP0800-20121206/12272_1 /TAXON_ID=210618 ORGANISM="Striatella unipunctata, Strain CCMP2910" /NCGR_SAMPLE_ID=MMETSP0800 /ASSEMBLY_ACC=CAM_ASM_000638 /LENGTH=148 /DNA_ID=CAMNT_0006592401 /DNA_START=80 /DNA_END=526 /DNA_ORIENTATION=-